MNDNELLQTFLDKDSTKVLLTSNHGWSVGYLKKVLGFFSDDSMVVLPGWFANKLEIRVKREASR